MLEMLVIRKTSGLFRLRTADEIKKAVSFYNVGPDQIPGLIVERIENTGKSCFPASAGRGAGERHAADADVQRSGVPAAVAAAASRAGVLARSGGAHREVPKQTGTFTIPARTTAVFIEPCFGQVAR